MYCVCQQMSHLCLYVFLQKDFRDNVVSSKKCKHFYLSFFIPLWSKAHFWQVHVMSVWCGNSNQQEWNSIKEQFSFTHTQRWPQHIWADEVSFRQSFSWFIRCSHDVQKESNVDLLWWFEMSVCFSPAVCKRRLQSSSLPLFVSLECVETLVFIHTSLDKLHPDVFLHPFCLSCSFPLFKCAFRRSSHGL